MNILIDLLPKEVTIDNKEYKINSDFRTSILFELLMQDSSIREEDKILMVLQLYYPQIPENINEAIDKMLWFYKCGKENASSKGSGKGKSVTQIYSFEYDDDYIYAAFMDQYGIDLQDIDYLHWWKFKAMFKSLKEDNEIVKIMGYRSMDISKSKGNGKGKSVTQIYSFEYDDDYIYAAFMDQYNIDLQDIDYLHWWKFKAMFKSLKEDNEIVKMMGYRSMDLSKVKDKEQKAYYKKMKDLYKIPTQISKDEEEKLKEIEKVLQNGGDLSELL